MKPLQAVEVLKQKAGAERYTQRTRQLGRISDKVVVSLPKEQDYLETFGI